MGSSFSSSSDSNNNRKSKKTSSSVPCRTMTPVEKGSMAVSTSHMLTMTPITVSTSAGTPLSGSIDSNKSKPIITASSSSSARGGNSSNLYISNRRNKFPSIKKRLSYHTVRTSPTSKSINQNKRSSLHQARGIDIDEKRNHKMKSKSSIISKAPSQSQHHSMSSSTSALVNITTHISLSTGCKITVINDTLKVFVIDLLTSEMGLDTCDSIRKIAEDHCTSVEEADMPQLSWRKLYTYTKMDLPCSDVSSLRQPMQDIMRKIKLVCGELFHNASGCSQLRPRSWKEPHLLKYVSFDDVQHTGIEMHYDGCDITWSLMLSNKSEYEGGGTFLRALEKNIKISKGQVLIHPGELYHKGVPITRGMRMLAICFMDGYNPQIYDPTCCATKKDITEKVSKDNKLEKEPDVVET